MILLKILKYYLIASYLIVIYICHWFMKNAEHNKEYSYLTENKLTMFMMLSILLAFSPLSLLVIIFNIGKDYFKKKFGSV